MSAVESFVNRDDVSRRADQARELVESLPARGVRMVALSQVDNAGVTRVKAVPITLLERAVRFGIRLHGPCPPGTPTLRGWAPTRLPGDETEFPLPGIQGSRPGSPAQAAWLEGASARA